MRKRITSLLLVLALCLTLLPASTLAAEAQGQAGQEQTALTQGNDGQTQAPGQNGTGEGDKTSDEVPDDAPDEEPDEAVSAVQALIDALPAAEDISDANADEVSGQLDAIDEAKQALTEEQAAQLDFAKYDAAAAAVLALAGEPDANEPAVLADTIDTQPSGSGTAEDPYQITSAAELIWLRDAVNAGEANTCAKLQQDVTHVDEIWTSIGTSKHPYTGTFNGNGHTIRVWLHGWGQALFGYVGADAKLTDLAVTKRQSENYSLNASAPLARSNAGTITRCRYSGGMTAKGSLGGLVYTNSGTIEACYVYAGQLNGGSRIEMYNGGWAGGIAYENTGTIVNSYFYGDIVQAQPNGTVRDIIGWGAIAYNNNSGTVSNCYYGADSDDGYGGKTEDQFRGGEVAYLLNGGTARDDWRQNRYAGDDTPVLDRSHAQVRKSGDYYVSLYPHVHCICGGGTTSGGHPQHSDVTYTAWTDDEAASQYGASSYTAANSLPKKPGKYYLTSDVTLRDTGTWRPADGTVLCLNGQTVREFAFDTPAYDVITVDSGVTFSLTECASIQGDIHCASSAATHTVNNSGTFNFYNGRLRDTKSKADGAAVYNTGTFNMYGGTINDNNTTARGGGVYNAGACNLYGGTITNNGTGGGVYNNGTLTVGGTATVTGNSPNVYLAAETTITLNSELDESARIGITAEKQSSLTDTAASIIVVKGGAAALNCFFPDDDGTYDLSYNDKDDVILHLIRDHTHCACAHKAKYAKDIGNHTEHVDHEFVAWTDELVKKQYGSDTTRTAATALPKVAGCYYLTGDVTPANAWWAADGTIICMNGHKIVSAGAIGSTVRVDSDVHVVLTDCKASGSISATRATGAAGLGFDSGAQNGIADIFGVSFSGTSSGVACNTGNTVNLYNSTISGTTSAIYNLGTVNIAGTVKTTSSTVGSGKYCVNNLGTLTVDGTLTAEGGNIGVANRKESNGSRSGTITVDGTLTSTGDNTGLSNLGTLTVTGTLTATGKGTATLASGLFNNGGTLTVTGTLTATGNTSGRSTYGLYNTGEGTVTVNGTFTASGGEYAVYNFGPLNMAGTVNANKNVYLGKDRTITVVGELDNATSITVQTSATPAAGSPVTIATTENANWIKAGSFVSWTPSKYAVSRTDEGRTVVLKAHEHAWGYTRSDDGATITAACANTDGLCGGADGGSVTIQAPTDLTYNGTAKAATVTETKWAADDVSAITYKQGEKILSSAPTDVGEYAASITVGGVTASVTYEIGKATPMAKDFVFAAPGNLNYDGNSKIVTVSSTKISMDDVTVKYYDKDGEEAEPKNAGDYIVKIDVAESTNYAAAKGLTADDWKFTIAKNTTTPDVTLSGDMVYKKNKIEPTVTVTVDGKTLTKDKDYEVTYGDNMNAGKNAGTVTITAKGNYDFAQIVKMFDITAQIIQVTAENKSSRVGQDIVELTYTHADGLPYEGDTFSGKLETTADKDKAGTYGITKGTLTLGSNYNVVFTPGTYTVEDKLPQDSFAFKDVVDGKVTKTYGDADFTVAATDEAEGSSVSYESTNTNVATVDSTGKVTIHAAGTTTIKATAHETKDYAEKKIFYTLTVKPKTLTKDDLTYSGPITKVYDGSNSAPRGLTVSVKPDSLVGDDTLAVNGTLKYNSANVSEADTITFTPDAITEGNYRLAAAEVLTITGASITKATPTYKKPTGVTAKYGQTLGDIALATPEGTTPGTWSWQTPQTVLDKIGSYTYDANFKPDDPNYKGVVGAAITVTVGKADGNNLKTVELTQKYTDASEHTYTPDWSGLPNGQTWSYGCESSSTLLIKKDVSAESGKLTYAISGGKAGDTVTITLKASCNNYEDFTITLTITLTEKDDQQALKLTGGTTVVYGQTLQLGTSGGSGTGAVTYAITDVDGQATIDADGKLTPVKVGTVKVKATKAEDANYNAITSAEVEITITKATPTGEPKYTEITTSGKTLADAALTLDGSTLKPNTGTLEWVDDKGNARPGDTKVEANTSYKWRFTPADANYTTLTGSIELYHKSSSGGGGWYYTYHTIKATAGTNGSISPSGWTSVRDGRGQTFTITPDKGYAVAKVLVDGKSVGAVKSYTFKNVTKDHTIEAIFMKSNGNPQTGVFVDVAEGSYYEEAIDWAVEKGITNGVSSNMFAPNDPCTRAQIVTFLWRAAGSPAPKSMSSFTDVPADAFYAKAVAWAVENGITSGTGESKFSPNSTCTRAQAVTFLYRASGSPAVSGKAEFSDVSTTAFYADAVAWAAKKGITTGIGGGLFGSDNDCTRGQIVTFLWRAMAE